MEGLAAKTPPVACATNRRRISIVALVALVACSAALLAFTVTPDFLTRHGVWPFYAVIFGFGLSRSFWLSLTLLAVSGMADNVSVVIRSTLLQLMTPPELLGRVSAVNAIFVGSSNELGAFESGVAARLLGTVQAVVLGGIASLGVVAVTAARVPQLRRLRRIG